MLIVFEGIDRSGKTTQCGMLRDFLQRHHSKVTALKHPDRTAPYVGPLISDYLAKKIDPSPAAGSLLLSASLWTTADQLRKVQKDDSTHFILLDRYVWTNIAYSMQRGMLREVMEKICEDLPIPDLTIYLKSVPEDISQREGFGEELFDQIAFQRGVSAIMDDITLQTTWPVLVVDSNGSIESIHQIILGHLNL